MEWLKKIMEGMNLTSEQVATITKGVEANYKDHVPKQKYDEVAEAKKDLEGQVKERDQQLTDLKKNVGDNDALKKQIEDLQADNKAKDEDLKTKIRDLSINSAIKLALAGKVHDADLVAGLLDKTKIEINEDGSIKAGIDDQLKGLRESKAFLFVDEKGPKPRGWKPADGTGDYNGGGQDDGAAFGKRLAEMNKGNEGLDQARNTYFE